MTSTVSRKTDMPVDTPAPARIVIERSHHSQSDAGLALLSHLANTPEGCSFDVLFEVFVHAKGGAQVPTATIHNLQNILFHLVARGQLTVSGKRPQPRVWRLGDLSKCAFTAKTRAAFVALSSVNMTAILKSTQGINDEVAAPAAEVYVGLPTPPPQYDVMYGPLYQPVPGPVLRAGSQDFKRLASHGYGC